MSRLTRRQISDFRDTVFRHYRLHGRHDLPWRRTTDPYRILVSEVMLQQTPVPRVVPKYREFTARFPDVRSLAASPLREVLRLWSGLGYNRRALYLKRAAEIIVREHGGLVPDTLLGLDALPGIGPDTAGAILAYAFNRPAVFLETNVRTVLVRFLFPGRRPVSVRILRDAAARALDRRDPRRWYAALMDYGAWLKRGGDPARGRVARPRQPRFEGSDRQLRGRIIRALTARPQTAPALCTLLAQPASRIGRLLAALAAEGLVARRGRRYGIA